MKNVDISIQFTNHYKLLVSISDDYLLEALKSYCETRDFITFKTRGKNPVLRRELKISKLWETETSESIKIDAGLVDYLVAWVRSINRDMYDLNLSVDVPQVDSVTLNERWTNILRDNQREDNVALTRYYGGLAAQHTGYGKTLCMLSIIECMPGRSVILVPNSGVLSEVQLRGEEFGVTIPHYLWDSSIGCNVLNPVGFLRANEAKKEEAQEWLFRVENVFTDEAHYLQANSWNDMFNIFLPNVKRAYGFSASPDSKDGKHLSPNEMGIRKLGFKSAKIVGLSGTTRVKRKSTADMTLIEVKASITPEINSIPKDNWQIALDTMLMRPECARVISEIIKRFPKIKFYIPVHSIHAGKTLFEQIIRYGVEGIFWCAGETIPESNSKEDKLAFVKKLIVQDKYRFLMTTSVAYEGVDMPALSGIIPLIGKSYRTVMQPAGRSSRGGELMYVLLHDKHNRVMENQTRERKSKITREYNVVKRVTLSL